VEHSRPFPTQNTKQQSLSLHSLSLNTSPSISRATHSAAARRPHPASLPAGALPTPQSRLIPSPPPHPQAPNRLFFAYPSDWPDDRRRERWTPVSRGPARLRLGFAVDLSAVGAAARPGHQGLLFAIPVTGRLQGCRRARAPAHRRRLRGVSWQQVSLDAAVSAASEGPAPTPQFSRTSLIDIKV
jgi:hypothetical protein